MTDQIGPRSARQADGRIMNMRILVMSIPATIGSMIVALAIF